MIGDYVITHNRTVIYSFDQVDLARCLQVAQARANIKQGVARDDGHNRNLPDYDPRIPHMLGHRAEWAFCRLLGIDPPMDVSKGGDKHEPDVYFPYIGKSFEIKYVDYNGPNIYFPLASANPHAMQADFGVLMRRVKGCKARDPYTPYIEFYGYFERKTFVRHATLQDFGYGPRLALGAEYITPFMGFLDRLVSFYERRNNRQPT